MGTSKKLVKVLVLGVGEEPRIEEVESPWERAKELLDDGYIQSVTMSNGVTMYCDEDAGDEDAVGKNLPFNRNVPDIGAVLPEGMDFLVVLGGEKNLAKAGELGVHQVRGKFLLTNLKVTGDGEDEYSDIPPKLLEAYLAFFEHPMSMLCRRCGKKLPTPAHVYCGAACSAQAEMHILR